MPLCYFFTLLLCYRPAPPPASFRLFTASPCHAAGPAFLLVCHGAALYRPAADYVKTQNALLMAIRLSP